MACLPPRKMPYNKISKQDANPLQILLQMGFPKNRALKALAATGNRSVQLASDWLLTHVNDAHIDTEEPREYILYASPTGQLLVQLLKFWDKSKIEGWNGAHNFPPHITLIPFFKGADNVSLLLGKAVKQALETVGLPPTSTLKWEPYMSTNFMGLFISDEHAEYLNKIALQYAQLVSSLYMYERKSFKKLWTMVIAKHKKQESAFAGVKIHINGSSENCIVPEKHSNSSIAEPQTKSLHLTLAYHFDVSAYDGLKKLVDEIELTEVQSPAWEIRLYSRDPRFANHQVYKVVQSYVPEASDELELVLGDYVYIEEKQFESSPDGWVFGTSWLTGLSGQLPGVYTRRTPDSDAWTLHRAILTTNKSSDCKSDCSSTTNVEMATNYPHEDAEKLGFEKSEETYKVWEQYWKTAIEHKTENVLNTTQDEEGKTNGTSNNGDINIGKSGKSNGVNESSKADRRWIFALRHGERVDLTYGSWVPFCFDDNGTYTRKDLNMPLTLAQREGGADSYAKDSPLTRVGQMQAYLVGEGLRAANVSLGHVYASPALRCVETAHNLLQGFRSDPSLKVRVEPGLFEYKMWHAAKGMGPFMTPMELHKAGYNVDLNYKSYVEMDVHAPETIEEFYKRNEFVIQSAVKDTEAEGGNIIFVGHATTLDIMVTALRRLQRGGAQPEYQLAKFLHRVPYCALAAMRDRPLELVAPPCPPCINSSSARFDWKMLIDVANE